MWLSAFGRDFRLALRMLSHQPALAAIAIITLAVGVGANAAIFSVLHAVLLRPLPYPAPEQLVGVVDRFQIGPNLTSPTIPEILDIRRGTRTLAGVSFMDNRDFQIRGGVEPARVLAARTEPAFLSLLGAQPLLGRLFTADDSAAGAEPVVILAHGLWQRNFGSDRTIVGKRIDVNGVPATIVGVLPANFGFDYFGAEPVDIYAPYPLIPIYTSRAGEFASIRRVLAIGRLKNGATVAQAAAEMDTLSRGIAAQYPALYRQGSDGRDVGFRMDALELRSMLLDRGRPLALLLFAAVTLVLAIAAVNMSQFLLARAVDREPEIALRHALGAGRGRVLRQLSAEAALLAVVVAGTSAAIAWWLIRALNVVIPSPEQVGGPIALDANILVFTLAVSLLVTILCSLVPALRVTRRAPINLLEQRQTTRVRVRARYVLLAAQVAVAVTLLAAASLVMRSVSRLESGDRGYDPEPVTALRIRALLRTPPPTGPLYARYLERVRAVPGVAAAAIADFPLPVAADVEFSIEGAASDAATLSRQQASYRIVSPDYFRTLGIRQIAGRTFTDGDRAGQPPVAIVNEQLARQMWPKQSPLGRRIRAGRGPRAAVLDIVGVVADVRPPLQLAPVPQIYVSYLQQSEPSVMLLIRQGGATPPAIADIKRAIWSVEPAQPVFDVRPLTQVVGDFTRQPHSISVVLSGFALLAVIISAAGVLTLIAYVTSRRMREMALRRVVGARTAHVLTALAGPTFTWTCAGLIVGMVAAFGAARALRGVVAGVQSIEPVPLAVVGLVYLAVAVGAMCAPAWGALRRDPAVILRAE